MTLRPLYVFASDAGGLPPREPLRARCPAWSEGSAITALIPRVRNSARFPREEYALSASTRSGRVRGRPGPRRATRTPPSRCVNMVSRHLVPGRASAPVGDPCHHTAGGPWSTTRPETGRSRGQAARSADSCDSKGPPVSRGRVAPCWWARLTVESTLTDQSTSPT